MKADQSTIDWLSSFYEAIDALRFEQVEEFLHPDCAIRYANGAVVSGRERIVSGMRRFLGALARVRHEIKHVWTEGQELIFELEVTYTRQDGQVIVRPGVGIFVLEDGSVREQRLFVDSSGVWD